METLRATTILCVRKDGRVAMGGDGQVTVGEAVGGVRDGGVRGAAVGGGGGAVTGQVDV